MARYNDEHKHATRERIIECAGRRFKREGIDRSGISALMADASLTNGAFYVHFTAKDDLVRAVVVDQIRRQRAAYGGQPFTRASFDRFLRYYLSSEHVADREGGCLSAALLSEMSRPGHPARHVYAAEMMPMIDDIAAAIPGEDARDRAAAVFAAMIGTLQLARAVPDAQVAEAILHQGIATLRALLARPVDVTTARD